MDLIKVVIIIDIRRESRQIGTMAPPRFSILLLHILLNSPWSRPTPTTALSTGASIVASQSGGRRHHSPQRTRRHYPRGGGGGGGGGGVDHDAEWEGARLRMEEATLVEGLLRDAVAVVRQGDRRGGIVVLEDDDSNRDDGRSRMILFPSVRQCNSGKRNVPSRMPPSLIVFRFVW